MQSSNQNQNQSNVDDYMTLPQMIAAIKNCQQRIDTLEKGNNSPKLKIGRINSWENYIQEVLENGKMWSTHSIAEEIKNLHPELGEFNHNKIQIACGKLGRAGVIDKVTHGVYRKKA